MRFKTWFENLAGPGGGPSPDADSPELMGRDDARKGVGAFPAYAEKDTPPSTGRSPTARYLDPRFARMKKRMRREWEEEEPQNLPSVTIIKSIMPQIVQAAQKVYDAWSQNDDGWDEMYGGGGICHDIASAICDVLYGAGVECTTFSQSIGEVHVYAIAKFAEGVYSVDIPPGVYETGGGYTWKKTSDVVFDANDVYVDRISVDPNDFAEYGEY